MKFEINKKEMLEALSSVKAAVASRATLPILGGIKLEGSDGEIVLETTDLEFAIRLQTTAETANGQASAVVPAKNFAKAVKAVDGSTVTVEIQEGDDHPSVQVSCHKRTVTIESFSIDDWPEIAADVEWSPFCQTDSSALADVLGKVVSCASNDESRPVLTGVQFSLSNGEKTAELVATDSYRLGVAKLEVEPIGDAPDPSPILPAKVLKGLANQLKRFEDQVVLRMGSAGQPDHPRTLIQISFGSVPSNSPRLGGEQKYEGES